MHRRRRAAKPDTAARIALRRRSRYDHVILPSLAPTVVKPKILIVDDEEFSPALLEALLSDQFAISCAQSGEAALKALETDEPQVILLDVEMPSGMNGYDTCRAIKANPATQHIPVFFVSAHTEAEDRLKAYEAGGDDYVSKPLNAEEIRHKITLSLAHQQARDELAEKSLRATNAALSSIREAADAGLVLGFANDLACRTSYADIAEAALHTLGKIHMEGAVQLRDGGTHYSRNSGGECTQVETDVLTRMAQERRIVDIGERSAFNYERATLIVYRMPLADPPLYGRLKDTIVKMAESLDTHMRALDAFHAETARADALKTVCQQAAVLVRELAAHADAHHAQDNALRDKLAALKTALSAPQPQRSDTPRKPARVNDVELF